VPLIVLIAIALRNMQSFAARFFAAFRFGIGNEETANIANLHMVRVVMPIDVLAIFLPAISTS
jgi:hypothetical protein